MRSFHLNHWRKRSYKVCARIHYDKVLFRLINSSSRVLRAIGIWREGHPWHQRTALYDRVPHDYKRHAAANGENTAYKWAPNVISTVICFVYNLLSNILYWYFSLLLKVFFYKFRCSQIEHSFLIVFKMYDNFFLFSK